MYELVEKPFSLRQVNKVRHAQGRWRIVGRGSRTTIKEVEHVVGLDPDSLAYRLHVDLADSRPLARSVESIKRDFNQLTFDLLAIHFSEGSGHPPRRNSRRPLARIQIDSKMVIRRDHAHPPIKLIGESDTRFNCPL